MAVKDIFQIEGIKTSVCNRAYYELYPPASQTAACVKLLQQKGACVVGTTKLASFAATEEPIECVDYQAPWNPRADGYQSPAGSSSGSGVAVASYQWVDIAIGSDSKFLSSHEHHIHHDLPKAASGSGRRPGHWNGCFAHRPSHGVLPVEGYIPSFKLALPPYFRPVILPNLIPKTGNLMCQLSSVELLIHANSLRNTGMETTCHAISHLSVFEGVSH